MSYIQKKFPEIITFIHQRFSDLRGEEKAKYSKFYKSAINIWTNKDLQKINTAKQNNLNYLPIYSNNFNEIIEIFKKYVEN